jgi:hypothetical protein
LLFLKIALFLRRFVMNNILRQIIVIVTFAATLVVNGLASSGALGGRAIGDISDSFPIYFVPAGLTFSVWGVIYLALTAFVVYQALPSQRENATIKKISWLFVFSNIVNMGWLLAFQGEQFLLSLPFMLVLLGSLIAIYLRLDIGKSVSRATYWLLQVPFSIYMAWITIATIANVSQALYASGVTELGLGGPAWAAIMIAVGTVVISAVIYTGRGNIAYGLTTVWAIAGIVIKQAERSELVGAAAIIAIVVILAVLAFSLWQNRRPEAAGSNMGKPARAA